MKKIKKGFTLAETLVTMSVIAVVAAIALPSISRLRPNQEMVMLKKVYYLTGRMVNELVNDEDFYPDDDTENKSGFSHVNTTPEATYHGKEYKGNDKFCGLFAARMNVKGDINCVNGLSFTDGQAPGNGSFTTADGVVWILPFGDFSRGGAMDAKESIYVDVNGDSASNCFPGANCKKPDRFEIKIDRWGKLYIDDDTTRKYLSLTNVTKSYNEIKETQVQPEVEE